jgi:hypothetical protein
MLTPKSAPHNINIMTTVDAGIANEIRYPSRKIFIQIGNDRHGRAGTKPVEQTPVKGLQYDVPHRRCTTCGNISARPIDMLHSFHFQNQISKSNFKIKFQNQNYISISKYFYT